MLGLNMITKLDLTLQACKADGFLHRHWVCTVEDGITRLKSHKAIHNAQKANSLLHPHRVCTIKDHETEITQSDTWCLRPVNHYDTK